EVGVVVGGDGVGGGGGVGAWEDLRAGGYRGAAQPPARGAFGHRDGGVAVYPPDLMRIGVGDNKDLACLGHEPDRGGHAGAIALEGGEAEVFALELRRCRPGLTAPRWICAGAWGGAAGAHVDRFPIRDLARRRRGAPRSRPCAWSQS